MFVTIGKKYKILHDYCYLTLIADWAIKMNWQINVVFKLTIKSLHCINSRKEYLFERVVDAQ